jgi:NAD(P)-dependent dehydrogenase (short-subunit alcohol dehydrogenase family)
MKIIITGGASGLGEAITRRIASACPDSDLHITYNNSQSNAIKLSTEFKNITSHKCNFSNIVEVDKFVAQINGINPDVLINNANTTPFLQKHFHKSKPEDYLAGFENDILPLIKITGESILCFRKKKFGKIINISTAALVGKPPVGSSVYIANKAYLEALSRSWATENIGSNITSNCIAPSMMATSLTNGIDERLLNGIVSNHPLKQLLPVNDVADTVLFFILSSQNINGAILTLNAGMDIR